MLPGWTLVPELPASAPVSIGTPLPLPPIASKCEVFLRYSKPRIYLYLPYFNKVFLLTRHADHADVAVDNPGRAGPGQPCQGSATSTSRVGGRVGGC